VQGVQMVEPATRRVVQTLPQRAAFLGAAWAPDSQRLYASGGDDDAVYVYDWTGDSLVRRDTIVLERKASPRARGRRYPAGVAVSRDGRSLYVAENLGDSLAVVDVTTGTVRQRLATERYPYGVVVAPDGSVYVSAWGGYTVSMFRPLAGGGLAPVRRIRVGRHPSAIALAPDGRRLFVTLGSMDRVVVVDTKAKGAARVVAAFDDRPALDPTAVRAPRSGSTPNALAFAPDGRRLYVAEADNNAVAVYALAREVASVPRLLGRIPAGWYPTAMLPWGSAGSTLLVANAKGTGTRANPGGPQPGVSREHVGPDRPDTTYTLGQIDGTMQLVDVEHMDSARLAGLSMRVARANGWTGEQGPGAGDRGPGKSVSGPRSPVPGTAYPPIRHVIYIVKENRTYDQVLGDLAQADGDTSLLFFPRDVSPNHHALAERFGIFDRFFVNAEVSPDGHNWSMAAYTTDYLQKTVPSNYSDRGRSYDYEGSNRGERETAEDAAEPGNGYLWNLAQRKGVTFRNYGEFVRPAGKDADDDDMPRGYKGIKPFLDANTHPTFPGFDMNIPDQRRADIWIAELQEFVKRGTYPSLSIVRLPNDHTSGARAGMPTPRAYMADNDLALGRMIEAYSRTPFWRESAFFILEDDAQNGPDHVDSHRSPLLVVSPWAKGGVFHRFANTTDVLRTMEEILGLDALSQFDAYGRPLREIWRDTPDVTPWTALRPSVSLDERNPRNTRGAAASEKLDLRFEDVADEALFNRILWATIKGERTPFPGTSRASALDVIRQ
jgi:YVTN family beta-propeller protein